ncbi:hypothetical protein [Cryobacterium sp. TMT1-66-1]|uniref:hypothetical protein n=1 Tax=Cryobacterium sp. TMT1-66-1 TaxID=1259242 RepID=UPI00106BEEC2|nr:hypothetical protein [Cryobacterium sp. TMT1-66-1]TFD09302.1 hypothetical protein E3T29_03880 [Cryobacterium sp. TMT1-66-1]
MLRRILILPTVFLALVALSGCAAEPVPEPSATSTTSPTATPAAATSPLSCDDIAAPGDIANVFADPAGTVPTPVAAMQPSTFLVEYAVPALGGLACSWRVGAAAGNPMDHQSDSDWAYMSVKVLPGAADSWAPNDSGAGPADPLTSIGGIEAATGCGDPGCFISAPVGDAWVAVQVCADPSGYCTVIFSLGESAYSVESVSQAVAVAEAIIAQAR